MGMVPKDSPSSVSVSMEVVPHESSVGLSTSLPLEVTPVRAVFQKNILFGCHSAPVRLRCNTGPVWGFIGMGNLLAPFPGLDLDP